MVVGFAKSVYGLRVLASANLGTGSLKFIDLHHLLA